MIPQIILLGTFLLITFGITVLLPIQLSKIEAEEEEVRRRMEKGKYMLNPKQARACYVLRRRRRELTRRINSGMGSEDSIKFDLDEHQAISVLLDLVREITKEEKEDNDLEKINNNV